MAEHTVSAAYKSIKKKAPGAFGPVYKAGELFDKTGITSPFYFANAVYAGNLCSFLQSEKFDAVICTHIYGMEAMTAVRKKQRDTTPCFGVLTDYTCIPFLPETDLDRYFIPHDDLTDELVSKKMPAEKLISTGIPVSADFTEPCGRAAARNALVIPENRQVYLIMSSGIGSGNIKVMCDGFLRRERKDYRCIYAYH